VAIRALQQYTTFSIRLRVRIGLFPSESKVEGTGYKRYLLSLIEMLAVILCFSEDLSGTKISAHAEPCRRDLTVARPRRRRNAISAAVMTTAITEYAVRISLSIMKYIFGVDAGFIG
jgi:DNA-binding transcriptional MerR regulator